jgi:hypothetical protein
MKHFPWFLFAFIPGIGILISIILAHIDIDNDSGKTYFDAIGEEVGMSIFIIVQTTFVVACLVVIAMWWWKAVFVYFALFSILTIIGRHAQ